MSTGRGHTQTTTAGVVRTLPVTQAAQDDEALLEGLQMGAPWAKAALFDRYAPHVERILRRVLGRDRELADIIHDTFVQAYASVEGVRDPKALKGWLSSVAVFTARGVIRRRKVRSWLKFWDPNEVPEEHAPVADPTTREALRRTYAILDGMSADERIAFALRFIDMMELTEVASACGCSLATIKRRLSRAESAFLEAAREDSVLGGRIEGGRWANR